METGRPSPGVNIEKDIGCAIWSGVNVLISGGDPEARAALARVIHERSVCRRGPFIAVEADWGPVSTPTGAHGAWRSARGGTLFIEEALALNGEAQVELMRLFDVSNRRAGTETTRVIAATAHNLLDRVASRGFRDDLFYRLNMIHVRLRAERRQHPPWLM